MQSKQYATWHSIYHTFKITTEDLFKLYTAYATLDTDKSGTLDVTEFLRAIDYDSTPFSRRVFSMFDGDGSGVVDYFEYVVSVWNYCTLSKYSLGKTKSTLFPR
jgi:Ca2+-binding EF-hand superfamily protein